jgi:hypothetical protein
MHSRSLCLAALVGALFLVCPAPAPGQSQLVPLVTDQSVLPLSNNFRPPAGYEVVNQNGDFAFVGGPADSAVFLRLAGAAAPVRVFQMREKVPGFPGSRADLIYPLMINNSGRLAFRLDFGLSTGEVQSVILTYDGSLHKIASGVDQAPGGDGARFERGLSLAGFNDRGDVALTSSLVPFLSGLPAQTTVYIAPGGAAPVRLVGVGDPAPGTGGKFSSVGAGSLNNQGELLFRGGISTGGSGLFVASIEGGVRKIVWDGDPDPRNGTPLISSGGGLLNNSGQVAFYANLAIWINTPGEGTSLAVASGDTVPGPVGGTFGEPPASYLNGPAAFNDAGEIAFTSAVRGSSMTGNGLFRFRPGGSLEIVAYNRLPAPGAAGLEFGSQGSISMNSGGTISFRAGLRVPGTSTIISYGIYQQAGSDSLTSVALDGQAVPVIGGVYRLANSPTTRTLNESGAVFFWAESLGGTAYYGDFLVSGSRTQILMSTADPLPEGSTVSFRTFGAVAAGDYVGFCAFRNGGGCSVGIHKISTGEDLIVATDGDELPSGLGGGRILPSCGSPYVNSNGSVVFRAAVYGGSQGYGGVILMRMPEGELKKIAATGDIDPATFKAFSGVNLPGWRPSPLKDDGRVVFRATDAGSTSTTGIFIGAPDADPVKVAVIGDSAGGKTIAGFGSSSSTIMNQAGQVAFLATTEAGNSQSLALFVWTPPAYLVKVIAVEDPGPDGTTFSGLGLADLNNNGGLVFAATLSGGARGGIFTASSTTPPTALALDGQPAPAGGNFSIAAARADLAINDQGDVVFRAELTGGDSDSGYFMRRGSSGPLQPVMLQGMPAPGTGGVFGTVPYGINGVLGEGIQLAQTGDVALNSRYAIGNATSVSYWHFKTDDSLELIAARGRATPEFGDGAAVLSQPGGGWNSGGRYPFCASISGGTFIEGIILSVPPPVAVAGPDQTLECCSHDGASFTLDGSSSSDPNGDPLKFVWKDGEGNIVGNSALLTLTRPCGSYTFTLTVTNLPGVSATASTHVVIQDTAAPALKVTVTPANLWPPDNKLVQVTASIDVSDVCDSSPRVTLVSITSNETLAPDDIKGATLGTDCRTFQLRATRAGNGPGRTYTITYSATDAAGNSISKTAQVVVLHGVGKR